MGKLPTKKKGTGIASSPGEKKSHASRKGGINAKRSYKNQGEIRSFILPWEGVQRERKTKRLSYTQARECRLEGWGPALTGEKFKRGGTGGGTWVPIYQ